MVEATGLDKGKSQDESIFQNKKVKCSTGEVTNQETAVKTKKGLNPNYKTSVFSLVFRCVVNTLICYSCLLLLPEAIVLPASGRACRSG